MRDNHVLEVDYDGIKLTTGSTIKILAGNLIEQSGRHGIMLCREVVDGNHLFQNTIRNSGFYGIYVNQGDSNTIHGNLVEGSHQWAVSLNLADDNTVIANDLQSNGEFRLLSQRGVHPGPGRWGPQQLRGGHQRGLDRQLLAGPLRPAGPDQRDRGDGVSVVGNSDPIHRQFDLTTLPYPSDPPTSPS